jgi:hypothetical protein
VPYAFQVSAVDYDGTLTDGGRPAPDVVTVLRGQRAPGAQDRVVAGRILVELRDDYPEVDDEFALIVAENGEVRKATPGAHRGGLRRVRRRAVAPRRPRASGGGCC